MPLGGRILEAHTDHKSAETSQMVIEQYMTDMKKTLANMEMMQYDDE